MSDVNYSIVSGRLVKDSVLTKTKEGLSRLDFCLATNRNVKNKEKNTWESKASYLYMSLFGERAEKMQAFLIKGKSIAVEGETRVSEWMSDGKKHSRQFLLPLKIDFIGGGSSKKENNENGQVENSQAASEDPSVATGADEIPFDDSYYPDSEVPSTVQNGEEKW